MGCSNSKTPTSQENATGAKQAKFKEVKQNNYPVSEAFTIPMDSQSITKPPRRIQELLKMSEELAPPTLEDLESKQQEAALRREELLQQKQQTAQKLAQTLLSEAAQAEAEAGQQPAPAVTFLADNAAQ